jgi:hypothetical protein
MALDQDILVEVIDVCPKSHTGDVLWGFNIDHPSIGYATDKDSLPVAGWVLAKKSKVKEVQILSTGKLVQSIPIDQIRLDVAKNYPEASNPEKSGFSSTLVPSNLEMSKLELFEGEGEIILEAVLSNGRTLELCTIKIRRKLSHAEYMSALESKVNEDIERSKLLVQSGREKLEVSKIRLQKLKEGLESSSSVTS